MIKVLLVDDNRFALEYFSNLIDWKKYGFELAGTALDGEYAFAAFQSCSPQVIITDIQMPNVNGIELTEKILRAAPETIVLFLSSYEEFEYAKSALRLGVFDYMIKHEVTEETLIQKLLTIRKMLPDIAWKQRYIAEGNLQYLLSDAGQSSSEQLRRVYRSFPEQYHLCVMVQDSIYPEMKKLTAEPEQEIVENQIKEHLYQSEDMTAVVRIDKYAYVLLMKGSCPFYEMADTILDRFRTKFHTTISIIPVAEKSLIQNCFSCYGIVLKNLDRKYFYLPSSILYRDVFQADSAESGKLRTEEYYTMAENQEFGRLSQELQKSFRPVILAKDLKAFRTLTHAAVDILCIFQARIMDHRQQTLVQIPETGAEAYWYDASSIAHWLVSQFAVMDKLRDANMSNTYSKAVNDVLLYIHQHYQDSDLSVESVANYFDINMNQLNYLVKKEVGESVIKLITQTRMKKAKQLLGEKLQISDISQMTGYKTVSYFSNVFKKYYGVSPQEYRRTHK